MGRPHDVTRVVSEPGPPDILLEKRMCGHTQTAHSTKVFPEFRMYTENCTSEAETTYVQRGLGGGLEQVPHSGPDGT